jgi:hypothetical protein
LDYPLEKFSYWQAFFKIKTEEELKAVKRNKPNSKGARPSRGPKAIMSD